MAFSTEVHDFGLASINCCYFVCNTYLTYQLEIKGLVDQEPRLQYHQHMLVLTQPDFHTVSLGSIYLTAKVGH